MITKVPTLDQQTVIRPISWAAAECYVRLVPQYSDLQNIRLATLSIDSIESLALFVRNCRLSFAISLLQQMLVRGFKVYEPVLIDLNGQRRVVVPPVVENHRNRFVLFDGTHRVWAARRIGMDKLTVVCITDIPLPLPATPIPWEQVCLREDHYTTEENLKDFDRSLFRPVTTIFNGEATCIASEDKHEPQ